MSHRTFSWTEAGTKAEIFEVQRVGAPGEGWEEIQPLATLHSPDLLDPCINYLRRNGWSWVPAGSSLLTAQLNKGSLKDVVGYGD